MKLQLLEGPLLLWVDSKPRPVAQQMALDEALWASALPVLRVHQWCEPALSFGYFLRWQQVMDEAAKVGISSAQLQRRWTGGGLVIHGSDLAFSVAIAARNWRGKERFQDSISLIHGALAGALQAEGLAVEVVTQEQGDALNCFAHPVVDDLCLPDLNDFDDLSGRDSGKLKRKIVGAGQRRHRQGLLHQGSLQLREEEKQLLSSQWPERFAAHLCSEVRLASQQQIEQWEQGAEQLLPCYQAEAWQRKR